MHEASYVAVFDPSNEDSWRTTLYTSAAALVQGEDDAIANCANLASLLFHSLPDVSWCGWYLLRDGGLVLGPFAGKPACTRIRLGRGVCGTSAFERRTILVDDVEAFDGHIACDASTRSEVVIPLMLEDRLLGVLDLDSPIPARFSPDDAAFLESVCRLVAASSRFE